MDNGKMKDDLIIAQKERQIKIGKGDLKELNEERERMLEEIK